MEIPLGGSPCPLFGDQIGIWNVVFFVEGKKQDGPRKNHRSKDESLQQNQLTCDARFGSRILVTIFERVGIFI